MVMDASGRAELDELLGRLCDQALSEQETARLSELLRDEEAQQRYAEYMLLHEGLRAERGAGSLSAATLLAATVNERPRRRRWLLGGVGLSLAAAVAVVLVLWPRERPEGQGVAVVTRTAAARWATPVEIGTPLPPGRLVLEAGLAQLDLYSGATLVLEGPASLDLIDERTARLHHGRLRSRVPEPAKGLRLTLPGGDVVDLGTEFAVEQPRQGNAQIHVFDGAVEWRRGGNVTRLTQGQGLQGERRIVANDGAFADPGRLASAAVADTERRWQVWSAQRQRLIGDPTLLLYFDFQDAGPWGRSARNLAAPAWSAPDGAIVGGRWVPGRFPEKRALEFKRPSDRVLVDIPGEHRSFSIAAWVRFDGLDNEYNAFVHTNGWGPGGVHTHIQPNGTIALHLHGRERLSSQRRIGRADLGRWIHLAWVWDGAARRTSLYMDGRLDAQMSIGDPAPVRFGAAQIGNWDRQHRNLNGQIDEVMVLGRALRVEEITALASAGF
jgi:ferric-dicitrate binding protein FerR (iron transport regulator)